MIILKHYTNYLRIAGICIYRHRCNIAEMAPSNTQKVFVVGVGMTKFEKPGRRENFDYPDMGREAVTKALADCNLPYTAIQQAAVGYVYGDSTSGQRVLYEVGMTGIPIFNVNNNCSTGATALFLTRNMIKYGQSDCVLALGFDKMQPGSLTQTFTDRAPPLGRHVEKMASMAGLEAAPMSAQFFGNAGIAHMKRYGTTPRHMAMIAHKNHKHSVNNPYSQFNKEYSMEEIENSPKIFGPLTKLQCCPTSDGSAAAVLASERFVVEHKLQDKAVEILDMELGTDFSSTFSEDDPIKLVGSEMTKTAAAKVFSRTGLRPTDVQVVELHDCFSANEMITYEALGLCGEGEAGRFIEAGDNTYGGRYVVNPSGGLISKGHPLGATGLAQCAELCWQLRGEAGKRQVQNANIALQHNLGLGGAVVVALYKKGFQTNTQSGPAPSPSSGEDFEAAAVFDLIAQSLKENGEDLVKQAGGVFQFNVTKGPGGKQDTWIVDAKHGRGSVTRGGTVTGDVTLTMADKDLVSLLEGRLNAQKAFFQGLVKIKGNMALAIKLQTFLRDVKNLKAKL
uniref:Sterol carrier protein 2 n=2 Tax=Hirondellea gigas TaxID=1518452 RepID=A0A2P2I3S0_9CRUS